MPNIYFEPLSIETTIFFAKAFIYVLIKMKGKFLQVRILTLNMELKRVYV